MSHSVRSHYGRHDLELLFELQPRAAQKLLGLLQTVQVGTSRLVERDALEAFLERVHVAEDVSTVILTAREEKRTISKKKLRSLVRTDLAPVSCASLPSNLTIDRGRMEVRFETVEQLAEGMYFLARLLDGDGEEFVRRFEPEKKPLEAIDEDLRQLLSRLHK